VDLSVYIFLALHDLIECAYMNFHLILSCEQQRLAFGRLVVNKPRLVICDEATSALDVASEAKMYSLLRNMAQKDLKRGEDNKVALSPSGLTFISVGHRPSLLAYHDIKLRLNGGADYDVTQIEKQSVLPQSLTSNFM
jgi:vitamin B12/bleomycin/antimicrobial peptide transport system ATP-binding/permease protein